MDDTLKIEHLLTGDELAELLQVPRATLHRWRSHGDGPRSMRIGKHVRYRRSDIENWLDAQSMAGQ